MSEHEQEVENGEELIDEDGRNPTQRQIDEESNDEPAQGEGGQEAV
jgi:hypothetical protein